MIIMMPLKICVAKENYLIALLTELEKARSLGSAKPNSIQILRQICLVSRQILSKFYQMLQNVTELSQLLPNLKNFTKKKKITIFFITFLFVYTLILL